MEALKKNILIVISGFVAVVSIVVIFVYPVNGYIEELQKSAQARADKAKEISSLLDKPRSLPSTDPDKRTSGSLKTFPSRKVIDSGRDLQDRQANRAKAAYRRVVEFNRAGHDVTVKGTLPEGPARLYLDFRNDMVREFDRLYSEELNAGDLPPAEEYRKEAQKLREAWEKSVAGSENIEQQREIFLKNSESTAQKIRTEVPMRWITNKTQQDRNYDIRIYANKQNYYRLPAYVGEKSGVNPGFEAVWRLQVEYWVVRDVVTSIKSLNAKSGNVVTAPVKRFGTILVDTSVYASDAPGGARQPGAGDASAAGAAIAVGTAEPDPYAQIPEDARKSPTKRITNPLYDVVTFKLEVDIEARFVPEFIRSLSKERFISTLRFEIEPVDTLTRTHEGYRYGDQPVVTLRIDGEALFLREWTVANLRYATQAQDNVVYMAPVESNLALGPMPRLISGRLGIMPPFEGDQLKWNRDKRKWKEEDPKKKDESNQKSSEKKTNTGTQASK